MKFIKILTTLVFLSSFAFAQTETPKLTITGMVEEIALEKRPDDSDSYISDIKIRLTLKNESSVPIIFLQKHFISTNAEVTAQTEENEIQLGRTLNIGSSFAMKKKEWRELKKKYKKPKPPENLTRIVNPNETIEFEDVINLDSALSNSGSIGVLSNRTASLGIWKKQSQIQMKIRYETWSPLELRLGGKFREDKKIGFVKKLRKKWKNFGYLWTDNIEVEPISINFNPTTFKKLN